MEQEDPDVAVAGRCELAIERRDILGRLRIDLAQERLAEVRKYVVREAADEALQADDPDRGAVDLFDRPAAIEHPHACAAQQGDDLGDLVAVPVVVAEHRVDGHLQRPAGLG